jgi:hypothetical protein
MDRNAERARVEAEVRRKASRRVGFKLGFYWHVAVFALVNAALCAINLNTSPDYLWFLWPLAGWGVGLALHGFGTLGLGNARERMIEAEVERELARRGLA